MIESLLPIKLPPGLLYKGTQYQSKGRWYLGSLVRFFQGNIQPIGGWVQRSLSGATISGTPNAAVSWMMNSGACWMAIGTTTKLYVVSSLNVVYDITPSPLFSAPPYIWQLDLFGDFLIATYNSPPISSPDDASLNFFVWKGNSAAIATRTDGHLDDLAVDAFSSFISAPTAVFGVVTTPERFLFLLRGMAPAMIYGSSTSVVVNAAPDYSNRRVYWASQEAIFDFRPAPINTAGSFDLSTDGTLMCGKASRGQTLLWTTTDLWTATYIGGDFLYRFDRVGTNCGIIGQHGAIVLDTGAFWMGFSKFFLFDGFVKTIDCDVSDYVFGSFNSAAASTVWALANPQFNEVTWHYPSASASAPDRYVTYNYREGHWVVGILQRSIGVTQFAGAASPVPVMIDSAGHIYDHETGNNRGASSGVFLKSGPIEMGDGDQVMKIQRVVPDDKTAGDVTASLATKLFPNDAETANGPYTLTSPTSVRLTARQFLLTLTESAASAWRVGVIRLGVIMSGRR